MKISRTAEMREMDRLAVAKFGIPEEILMENAAAAATEAIRREFGIAGRSFAVISGPGNNGGDGLAVARMLKSRGAGVSVLLTPDRKKAAGAAAMNLRACEKLGIPICRFDGGAKAGRVIVEADAVVDGLLGTGLDREVSGAYAKIIALINASGKWVCSLDIPSGVSGDTGRAMGAAVRAKCTVAFGLPKPGNLIYPGHGLGGKLFVSHISFPPELYASEALKVSTFDYPRLPSRGPDAHKGSFGRALFIAGSSQYRGAPFFAAQSFLRAGGGLAFLACPAAIMPAVGSPGGEIVFLPQKTKNPGCLDMSCAAELLSWAEKSDLVVLGPGLSLDDGTRSLVRHLASKIKTPLLLDGDGLSAAAENPACLRGRAKGSVLTPHAAELARFGGCDAADIEAYRLSAALDASSSLKSTVVLKGAHSITATRDGRAFFNLSGNAGMATAGSGDALCGAVAAMHCLGLPLEEAARTGVFVHGLAGDLAKEARGEDGMLASDILEHLPAAVRLYREELPRLRAGLGGRMELL